MLVCLLMLLLLMLMPPLLVLAIFQDFVLFLLGGFNPAVVCMCVRVCSQYASYGLHFVHSCWSSCWANKLFTIDCKWYAMILFFYVLEPIGFLQHKFLDFYAKCNHLNEILSAFDIKYTHACICSMDVCMCCCFSVSEQQSFDIYFAYRKIHSISYLFRLILIYF